MKHWRTSARSGLEARLARIGRIPDPPPYGWVRAMRQALCMSGPELAKRMGRSSSRVGQIEEAEVNGSILVSTLRRAAEAMNCRLVYAFVPTEPLEQMVFRQAHLKAARRLSIADPDVLEESEGKRDRLRLEQLEDLTYEYVDRQGLWGWS